MKERKKGQYERKNESKKKENNERLRERIEWVHQIRRRIEKAV